MNALYDLARSQESRSQTISRLVRGERRNERWLYAVILAFTVGLAPLMAFAQMQLGFGVAIGIVIVAILAILMMRWPILGFYAVALCALVVEQEELAYNIFTDHLYVFFWPTRLQGLPERPIGFLVLFILLLIVLRQIAGRLGAPLRLGPLIAPFLFLLACVAMGVAHGMASGGDIKIIVLEVRPFWYLFLNYLLAYNLVTEKRHVIAFLWLTVIGTFIKAVQGVYIVLGPLGGHISGQNEIMAHEQSFFFVLVLLLIIMCLLLGRFRWLLWVALLSTPFLIVALIANNRRADYSAFLIGLIGAWLFVVIVRPEHRKALIVGMLVAALLFGGYVLAFQHSTSAFAQPAQAVISVIHPNTSDVRDQASNLYREIEDNDLKFTEKQSPILGYGFGRPFLQPVTLPNISTLDPYYLYIPHNTILWVWMRLGPLGLIALFYLFGGFIIRAGIMARNLRDRDLQFVAIFAIAVVLIELPLAYGDYQLFFYRNIFYLGLIMGMVMRLPDIDKKLSEAAAEAEAQPTPDAAATSGSVRPQQEPLRPEPARVPQPAGAYLRSALRLLRT